MKKETKLKKQLLTAKEWSKRTRQHWEEYDAKMTTTFYLLIAVEQLIKYLEMETQEAT